MSASAARGVPAMEAASPAMAEPTAYSFSDEALSGDLVRPDGEMLASAETPQNLPAPVTTDASTARRNYLVYRATFHLSVFEVSDTAARIKQMALDLGGFVATQANDHIAVRIPATEFERALTTIEQTGKVIARDVSAEDVGTHYRDLSIRLRTSEAMRQRLEELLARAQNVKEALEVERELERVVQEIERIKGQLRSLDDQLTYSSITVFFSQQPQPSIDQSRVFRLPFHWLSDLGMHSLLEVQP